MTDLDRLKSDLLRLSSPERAKVLSGFFKTGKGQYGEGDTFLGIMVPEQRRIARKYSHISLDNIRKLLSSAIHEHRLVALLILVETYRKSGDKERAEIVQFYLNNLKNINNWDLVDLSAEKIIGEFLTDKDRSVLYRLAKSENLWEKRIAIISTFAFIKRHGFEDTLKISEILLRDPHDLIHKAVGWMLREVGKRNQRSEEEFLKRHHLQMPRTMLRYAIERFDEKTRKSWLAKGR